MHNTHDYIQDNKHKPSITQDLHTQILLAMENTSYNIMLYIYFHPFTLKNDNTAIQSKNVLEGYKALFS